MCQMHAGMVINQMFVYISRPVAHIVVLQEVLSASYMKSTVYICVVVKFV